MARLSLVQCALVLLVACVLLPLAAADFGFTNWAFPYRATNLQSSTGSPTAVEYGGKIHVVFRSASTLYYTSSTNGVAFTTPQPWLDEYITNFDPELVVMTDSATNAQSLVLLVGQSSGSNSMYYATYNSAVSPFPFNAPVYTGKVSNLGGDTDAIYSPTLQRLLVVYLNNVCAYGCSTGEVPYNYGWTVSASLANGVWTWYNAASINSNGAQWPAASEVAIFTTATNTYFVQSGGGRGIIWYYNSGNWSPNQNPSILPGTVGDAVAYSASYSGFTAATFTTPLLCSNWTAVFYISPSDTSLSYTLVGQSGGGVKAGKSQLIGFNDGESIDVPQQPVAAYFSVTNAMYVYYVDTSISPFRIESTNATLDF